MKMGSSRNRENQAAPQASNSHGRHKRRSRNDNNSRRNFSFSNGKDEAHSEGRLNKKNIYNNGADGPITTEVSPAKLSDPANNRSMFTPQQQKVIIEHLLITKNNVPQKNYSHVPCKFFRQGACQAGDSCPFSHSLDTSTADQTPCEYFKRGNCKFGSKCANAHILPDGARANPSNHYKRESCIFEEVEEEEQVEDVYQQDEEFYIPTDFTDLLTPEELKRRNSRSSSMTSFSMKRPNSSDLNSLSSSSSSFGSEPLFSANSYSHQRTYSGASLSSSSSSYTASPLLHQQLAYFQPQTQQQSSPSYYKPTMNNSLQNKSYYSPWSPVNNGLVTRNSMSWLSNDLTKLRIDEEEALEFVETPSRANDAYDFAMNNQETQFIFDDLPDYNRV